MGTGQPQTPGQMPSQTSPSMPQMTGAQPPNPNDPASAAYYQQMMQGYYGYNPYYNGAMYPGQGTGMYPPREEAGEVEVKEEEEEEEVGEVEHGEENVDNSRVESAEQQDDTPGVSNDLSNEVEHEDVEEEIAQDYESEEEPKRRTNESDEEV